MRLLLILMNSPQKGPVTRSFDVSLMMARAKLQINCWVPGDSRRYDAHCDVIIMTLRWRHNGLDGISNHQPHHCLLSRLFGRRSKKTSKLRVTGLCAGNSPGTGEFPSQMASNAENASIWWRHHESFIVRGYVNSASKLTFQNWPNIFGIFGHRCAFKCPGPPLSIWINFVHSMDK